MNKTEGISMKKIISTSNAPAAIGPYSQAVVLNDMVYTSGVIPIDPANGTVVNGDIKVQTKRALQSLEALLKDSGSDLGKVVKTTVFIKNMEDFPLVNEVYASFFTDNFPARSCVEVARLPKDVLIEVEAVAYI
jgi:2-iminobutanoate/2-iminopropanoate deaminase